ncbi:MAG: c-type cytochrome [Rhodospirillaceae bacterium]|nr:c-type cytochrome [Rhodospirillaceae bacterium]
MALILLMALGCGEATPRQYETTKSNDTVQVSVIRPALSDAALAGEVLFNANCSLCHGANAAGTHQGPPLIHKIYEPGHHSDFSFRNAVRRGVRQHHWQFGDMAPVAGISSEEVDQIICYIREMQRANGIFDGDAFGTQC